MAELVKLAEDDIVTVDFGTRKYSIRSVGGDVFGLFILHYKSRYETCEGYMGATQVANYIRDVRNCTTANVTIRPDWDAQVGGIHA